MQLVIASANKNKVKEFETLIPSGIQLLNLSTVYPGGDIPETAETIEGNALLKANFVNDRFGLNCFADDSGLEVDALEGRPGVYSARYAGPQKSDVDNNAKLLQDLKGQAQRGAQFKTVIALVWQGQAHTFEGIIRGHILEAPRGNQGFGYDPLFVPEGYDQTFAEMDIAAKSAISHRGIATRQLIAFLKTVEKGS